MKHLIDIRSYTPDGSEALLIDANVWIFLLHPEEGKRPEIAAYATFLKRLIEADSRIAVTPMTLREYIYQHIQKSYKNTRNARSQVKNKNFKKWFRRCQEYEDAYKEVKINLATIQGSAELLTPAINYHTFEEAIDDVINVRRIDFNDSYLIRVAEDAGYGILTDDEDYKIITERNLTLYTANPKLL